MHAGPGACCCHPPCTSHQHTCTRCTAACTTAALTVPAGAHTATGSSCTHCSLWCSQGTPASHAPQAPPCVSPLTECAVPGTKTVPVLASVARGWGASPLIATDNPHNVSLRSTVARSCSQHQAVQGQHWEGACLFLLEHSCYIPCAHPSGSQTHGLPSLKQTRP